MIRNGHRHAVLLVICAVCLWPAAGRAGSGYYYGAHFGFWDFFEDDGAFGDAEGGFAFGPKAGIYFIAEKLGLAIDASAQVGLVGEDKDEWFLNLPTISVGVGTGFDAYMIYAGGAFSLLGLDGFADNVTVSLANPYAFGGLQLGWGGFIIRGEFQIGYVPRLGGEEDYAFTNIAITVGYGLYTSFL